MYQINILLQSFTCYISDVINVKKPRDQSAKHISFSRVLNGVLEYICLKNNGLPHDAAWPMTPQGRVQFHSLLLVFFGRTDHS